MTNWRYFEVRAAVHDQRKDYHAGTARAAVNKIARPFGPIDIRVTEKLWTAVHNGLPHSIWLRDFLRFGDADD